MNFRPYYGTRRLALTNFAPTAIRRRRVSVRADQLLGELGNWVSVAFRQFHLATDEFTAGVADPTYGGDLTPDNFAMSELVSRGVADRFDEVVAVLEELHIELGFQAPFQLAVQGWPPGSAPVGSKRKAARKHEDAAPADKTESQGTAAT
jgi:hypothetical protein